MQLYAHTLFNTSHTQNVNREYWKFILLSIKYLYGAC